MKFTNLLQFHKVNSGTFKLPKLDACGYVNNGQIYGWAL